MYQCNVCGTSSSEVEQCATRSNVRKFGLTKFHLWRCPSCLSLHAADEVDLAAAYRDYPYHRVGTQDATRFLMNSGYRNLLRRLKRAGFTKQSSFLDYGCGGGGFVHFLRERGYDASGWDEYSSEFNDPAMLKRQYDVVMSQDVIEHVAEPSELARTLTGLVKPGGVLAIGTPNAEAVDMKNAEQLFHMLHQPYHRHILSKRALVALGERFKWQLETLYTSMYAQTRMPFMNGRYFAYYVRTGDNTLDYGLEPPRLTLPALWSPVALFWAFFGSFFRSDENVMAVFRVPAV